MQKFERPPFTVSVKKTANVEVVVKIRKHINYLPSVCAKAKIIVYILDLPDVLYNPTKFQLNWIRTENFQLKV